MRKPKKKPAATFKQAPAVREVAVPLIQEFHAHLWEHDVRVEYLFRSDTPKKSGKPVWAKVQKVGSLAAYLGRSNTEEESARPFFVIIVSEPIWNHASPEQRRALVDHELCHCASGQDADGNRTISFRTHDLEEFVAIVDRHGHWAPELRSMAKAMAAHQQPALDLDVLADPPATPEPAPNTGIPPPELAATPTDLEPPPQPASVDAAHAPIQDRKYVDCPQCGGAAKRRGARATCGCGWSGTVPTGAIEKAA